MGQHLFGTKKKDERRIIVTGLVGAGQSTFLSRLAKEPRTGSVARREPTDGFFTEELDLPRQGVQLLAFDVGGSMKIRPFLRHLYAKANGIIFMVDSSENKDSHDLERIQLAKKELHAILSEAELPEGNVPLLVLANKQDKEGAMTLAEVTERLGLNTLRRRLWYIQKCSATTGEGIYEGLD
eukprot:Cvel_30465.t1-p1 / transcript=Cvel_30465.t1 / gene=Cvel_30465 / organism=Chromera_velia_CCMP2878 / gene_product=ADP-ribosylation factor, putative / transcript_product=ADP-ribosylation factor, putative / location=Cvel_scaffold4346:537-1081(-) / protein_length=181 / sequence_SO=supercontig / SO=protein_coding / is_pseudo=false